MAPRTATISQFAGATDSEDEIATSDVDRVLTPDSARENVAPGRRKAGQPKGNGTKVRKSMAKVTKVAKKAPSRRTSAGSVLATTKAKPKSAAEKRQALKDKTNTEMASDAEEVEDFDVTESIENIKRSASVVEDATSAAIKAPAKRGRPPKVKADDPSLLDASSDRPNARGAKRDGRTDDTSDVVRTTKLAPKASSVTKKPRVTKQAPSIEASRTIPETQPEPMDFEPSILPPLDNELDEDMEEPTPRPIVRAVSRARSVSKQRQPGAVNRRAGSASDTERRGNDPELRRKLGEMTRKFTNLELKYRDLQEVGGRSAEKNFEELKRLSDERATDADGLIASLKGELSDLKKSHSAQYADSKSLQTKLAAITTQNAELTSENKTLQASLLESQNEAKSLCAKLAANRTAAASVQSVDSKVPGSAVKNVAARTIMVGSAEAAKEAQIRQLKEDLYSDLTGLIINSVKRKEGEDEYSCIQTGRNGTLHFHLTIANGASATHPKTPSGLSYEDAEFAYEPLLDESRDRNLLDILPDYLAEEICFPRNHAAKFYARVAECMMKRVQVVEE
ncbi:chromosome segregation protein Csm1/Pcs1-domain-containing protein [Cryomyces antarcticus]